ncbi:non-ribosomal peptide synthetase [Planotetraspora kaengkrachanensis]|uniref:Non-ribosomal peptide synthetase n=1 Tax=Planotetraspora kaengkrachanensis TaxID=575193 RepID=A0A8J3PVT2_9ACTN|nr:non-ribosomal peptide synthetase [Planotetraspora kaengkrachanensis]GIG81950.1 non-ribosomal peptide synthetase [Planotetraspora kaengkrachanensis]
MTGLTLAQERLWILHRLDPDDASYNLPMMLRVRGALNTEALERALDVVLDRHEMLRCRFAEHGGTPVRMPTSPARVELVNCADVEEARAYTGAMAGRPFDLERGPMIRVALLTLAPDDHVLALVVHHIVADGWSLQVLRRDISDVYAAFDAGKPSPLAPLPMSYEDHVCRRRENAGDEAGTAYWVSALAGSQPLELPTDRPRPPVRSGRGDHIDFEVPGDLLDRLERVARAERCTLFMVLLAAFQVLLSRHSGRQDICVGTPTSGRDLVEAEPMVGYFAQMLVLRGDLDGDPTFRDLVRATRGRVLGALTHADVPLEQILTELQVERDPSRTPLFQAMFNFLREEHEGPGLGDARVEPFDHPFSQSRTDISLDIVQKPSGTSAMLTFDDALFTRAGVERMRRHLLTLLADIADRPGVRIGELALIDDEERADLLDRWNDTEVPSAPVPVLERFAAQVARTPTAVAVACAGVELTYAELDARSRRIAALLAGTGLRGGLVAVCLRRSADMIAALFAVWRAGAAYLPIDPEHPRNRIALVLDDSRAARVLTDRELSPLFPEDRVLLVEDAADREEADADAQEPADPEQAAYVLYTSGSTGRPKGVAVPHRALARFLDAMTAILGEQEDRTWLALTSLSFDISALEIFLPLTRGGRVEIAPDHLLRDGPALTRLIGAAGVTNVQATPSGWRMLTGAGLRDTRLDALVGGEALPLPLAADLRARVRRLVNMYGPTETTIWSSFWEVPEHPEEVTIGGPIAGTRLHVLDDRRVLAPVGVPGELCIAGDGVALGYLGRPSLTAERFVPDPYGPPGSRLYRTGDRVRRLPDGRVVFLGRDDGQVKLRGHRVELGEIEAVLEAHPGVRAAAVVVRNDALVAFVVGDAPDLAAHAAAALPPYMVPAVVVDMDALPLTPNGKVDRLALPSAVEVRPAAAPVRTPPRTWAERRVAAVFAEVLGVGEVGVEDDFFALGGHSLLAAKVVARMDAVPIRELFDHPTVAGFAARLAGGAGPAPLRRRPDGAVVPLSRAQERLWFLQRLDPGDASYNMYNVWRLRGRLDAGAFEGALRDLTARHETLRTRYPEADGTPVTDVLPEAGPDVEHIDVTSAAEARRLVAERTNASFDLAAAPPFRVSLLRLAEDDHVVCLVLHHIAGDGWSLNVLREELERLYAARRDGVAADLDEPPIQFGDVVYGLSGQDDGADLAYWRERLADPPTLELPTDRPRAAVPAHRGAFHGARLAAGPAAALERVAGEHRATLFMVLLAAFQVMLAGHTGKRDLLVGSTFAGRDRVELERLVGYFANTLVLRGDLTGDPSFADLLARTRDTVLEAMAHQRLPYEELAAESGGGARGPHLDAMFRTMLILHSQDETEITGAFADLDLEFFDSGYRQAKFDLMLEAWRDGEGLILSFGYDSDLFDPGTISLLAERFTLLCEAVAADHRRPVSLLPLLTPADAALLAGFEAQESRVTAGPTVPELIEAATAATPDAVALSCGDEAVTYAMLDRRVDALAARLRAGGVGRESVVGVCLDRSCDAVVSLLAVWRAGGAYLPIDPALPAGRIDWMLADSGAALVITRHEGLSGEIPVLVPGPVEDGAVEDGRAGDRPAGGGTRPAPSDAAYVIYTSGSTGLPKGVVVEHAALAARVEWMRADYGPGPGDRVVQFASLGFDTHAEEIHPALASGATVELLPDGALSLPELLAGPRGREVTVLDLPTAYWHRLVDQIDDIAWPGRLRLVILGGEQVHASAVARWRERFGDRVRLVNTYGPTEATIIATAADLGAADASPAGGRPPIGVPIAGARAAVVDEHGRRVPPGAPGELLLGGAGLARGYLGRPGLTAEKFVSGPDGGRCYRTGDLVRWRDDGRLEFIGRADDQLKVRGFRIEPGEIEARLAALPDAGEAAVTAHDGALVAYVTGTADPAVLQRHLAETLPPYMVPDVWVRLGELPMTPNGKVDRCALPPPDAPAERPFVAPETDAECLVAEVWEEVLRVDRVGVHDDFFALGGHSLLAVQVAARLRAAAEVDVPIRELFAHRTVAALAVVVEELVMRELSELSDDEAARLLETEA